MNAIFIGGCPRSGTTMLGSMLGAGKNCFVTPESQFKELLIFDKLSVKEIEKKLNESFRLNLWQLNNIKLDSISSKKDILPLLLQHYKQKKGITETRNIWVDHTPDNFELFGSLIKFFPTAKFVHIIRDSRGVASSVIPLDWGPNDAGEAADWWLQKVSFGFSAEICNPSNVVHVKYEEIIQDPETTLKNLCKKIGIEFIDEMLTGDNSFLPDYTKKQHSLVGNLPQKNQIDSWKQKLSTEEIKIIELKTGPVLSNLGCEVNHFGKWKLSFKQKTLLSLQRIWKELYAKIKFKKRKSKALKRLY